MNHFVVFVLLASLKTFAYTAKEGNVSAITGPFTYKTNFSSSPTGAESSQMGSPMLMAIGDISTHGSLELGIFYLNKTYFRERSGGYIAEKTQLMHITMGYREWINSYLSTSLSFFSAYSMAEPVLVHNDFGANRPDTSATDKVEYGFDFAVQYEFWSQDRWAIVGDVRYSWNVTPKENEFADHYGVMAGVRYFIQGKQKVKRPEL